jgi:hypothetical protein
MTVYQGRQAHCMLCPISMHRPCYYLHRVFDAASEDLERVVECSTPTFGGARVTAISAAFAYSNSDYGAHPTRTATRASWRSEQASGVPSDPRWFSQLDVKAVNINKCQYLNKSEHLKGPIMTVAVRKGAILAPRWSHSS